MKAFDVVGYTFNASFYCSDECLPSGTNPNGEEVGAVFADSEWDYYPTCDNCGEQCTDISLTAGAHYELDRDEDEDEDTE